MVMYAVVENERVVNVVLADAPAAPNWIESSTARKGWTYDPETGEFVPRVKTPEELAAEKARMEKVATMRAVAKAQSMVLREQIAGKLDTLPDEEKGELAYLYSAWSGDGVDYVTGDIVRRDAMPYRVLQDHTSQPDWTPETAVSLFTPLRVVSGPTPDPWVQPTGAHNAYSTGDRVVHDNPNDGSASWVYESAIDANTTEPGRDGTLDRYWTPIEAV